MKTARRSPLFLSMIMLAVAAGAAGCGISVEADVPEVEVTQKGLAFDGVPLGGLLGDVSIVQSFSQKHEKLELPDGLDTEVKALGVSLTAKSGIQDFAFIHNLRLTMTDGTHTPVELINYQQQPGAAPSGVLTMESANPVNTLDQWKTDSATFTVEVAGSLPSDPWTVDLGIRFAGKIKYQYK
jgi:hypothetical protein